ncbi:MAG: cytochrome c-type biogenesis protein CcmH [Polyangiaceae bacterium]
MNRLGKLLFSSLLAKRARGLVRIVVLAIGIFAAMPLFQIGEASGQLQGDMEGWHPVGIENEDQRKLFWSLICMCGCPRETLGTCNCNTAHAMRQELKADLAQGKSLADIQAAYAKRYGPQALAVPPNTGANWLLWALPLTAIALGAAGVVFLFTRWKRQNANEPTQEVASEGVTDAYDDKLDRELEELDRR